MYGIFTYLLQKLRQLIESYEKDCQDEKECNMYIKLLDVKVKHNLKCYVN